MNGSFHSLLGPGGGATPGLYGSGGRIYKCEVLGCWGVLFRQGVFSDRAAFFLPPCLGAESEEDPFKVKTGGSACPELEGSSGREPQEGGDERKRPGEWPQEAPHGVSDENQAYTRGASTGTR